MSQRESGSTLGVQAVLLATFVAVFEYLYFRSQGRFHPLFLPLACMTIPLGLHAQWTNTSVERLREKGLPRRTAFLLLAGTAASGALGLAGNHLITGHPW